MSNDFEAGLDAAREMIPGIARRRIYGTASLAGYLTSAIAVGLTAIDIAIPDAMVATLVVLGALMGPLGQLAAANVTIPVALAENPHFGSEELVVEETE